MLMKNYNHIFIFGMMVGSILAVSSSSWLLAWIGLEINLMSFLPLLINNIKPNSIEMAIKYFLVQVMASTIIIFLGILISNSMFTEMNSNLTLLITMALTLKAGVAPFHFWFPQVMSYTEWFQALLLLTWQKLAPLILISFSLNFMVFFSIVCSSIMGMMGGLNQINLKKILTFSSIIHSAWLISIIFISDKLWWTYYIIYCFLLISIIIPCSVLNIETINMINYTKIKISTKLLIILNLLSIAGLPPFLGFTIKMISISSLISYNFNMIILITLIMSSLIAFYFYARLMYSSLLMSSNFSKVFYLTPKMEKLLTKTLIVSFCGNFFISLVVLLT